ncbi:MAG TPA: polyprenyl synthetase family protein [Pirellulales bacterium]|nr:polyprenyl synthetase family protein [Pirellulales bacterium]
MSSAIRKLSPAGRISRSSARLAKPAEASEMAETADGPSAERGFLSTTAHIKRIPRPKSLRERLRRKASLLAERIEQAALPKQPELERLARELLTELELPEGFVGWTMVMLASAFWQPKIAAVPRDRRLLLLPGSLSHAADCQGAISARQMPDCARCAIAWLRRRAERLGYRVLWAEESVAALEALASAEIDAVMGVASLDLLEKALNQIPQFEVPCMAIPLVDGAADDCARSESGPSVAFDGDWIRRMIDLDFVADDASAPNYRHLIRAAQRMFDPDELEQLAPRMRIGPRLAELNGQGAALLDPLAGTEAIAYDFLTRGGKHSRPFITLAVYDAMTGGRCTLSDGHRSVAELPLSVKRAAVSIETFHKASLVHDDIEDDDQFRYGAATLHRALGVSTAINVGDYLIGLGYRLVSRESSALGADAVSDIMDRLAEAHMKLTEGQGAELLWRDSRRKLLSVAESLEIYALKTAPAFEAALITGLRLAGPSEAYLKPIGEFAKHLGIAFQIQNDLADWEPDNHNKLVAAGDVLGGRPTLLWALALEGLAEPSRLRLQSLATSSPVSEAIVCEIRDLYRLAEVFDKAQRLVQEYDNRARSVAESVGPAALCRLLHYLIDVVLKTRC